MHRRRVEARATAAQSSCTSHQNRSAVSDPPRSRGPRYPPGVVRQPPWRNGCPGRSERIAEDPVEASAIPRLERCRHDADRRTPSVRSSSFREVRTHPPQQHPVQCARCRVAWPVPGPISTTVDPALIDARCMTSSNTSPGARVGNGRTPPRPIERRAQHGSLTSSQRWVSRGPSTHPRAQSTSRSPPTVPTLSSARIPRLVASQARAPERQAQWHSAQAHRSPSLVPLPVLPAPCAHLG